jgi:hypothetical protein
MRVARRVARPCAEARITGVAFYDFLHGQTGVAPNGIELHPVLGFACLSRGRPSVHERVVHAALEGGD